MAHINDVTTCGSALGSAAFVPARPEPVMLALTEPIVGVGTPAAVTELWAFAASAAKPTEAGLARKTEYTFLRNVSPMIHETPLLLLLLLLLPELSSSKKAPRHWLFDSWVSLKSSGEMDQLWPPKARATLTVVEQAKERTSSTQGVDKLEVKRVRTVGVIPLVIASSRGGTGNLSIQLTDLSGGSANQRCARVDRSLRGAGR